MSIHDGQGRGLMGEPSNDYITRKDTLHLASGAATYDYGLRASMEHDIAGLDPVSDQDIPLPKEKAPAKLDGFFGEYLG